MKNISVYIPDGISTRVSRQILKGRKNSPTILFAAGVVGVVATTVMASRATLKLEEVLEKTEENLKTAKTIALQDRPDYSVEDYQKDKIYIYTRATVDIVKLYSPAILLGAASIACLAGSHNILSKRNASMMAAYAALDQTFSRYRNRVIDLYTKNEGADAAKMADDHFMYGSEERVVVKSTDGTEIKARRVAKFDASGYARFFDELNPNWNRNPEYNMVFLRCQQNYANDLLIHRGHVFLNDVYDMLGIERTGYGAVVGWVIEKDGGDNFIDFGVFNGKSESARDFVNGREASVLLDFNVDGVIYDKI